LRVDNARYRQLTLANSIQRAIQRAVGYARASSRIPGGVSGAVGAATLAAAAGRAMRSSAVANTASPSFNPGSSGGYVKAKTKKKKGSKKKPAFTKREKAAVKRLAARAPEPFFPVLDITGQYFHPIQTSTSFPCVPLQGFFGTALAGLTTTGLTPSRVGWNALELFNNNTLTSVISGLPIVNLPYVTSATNVPRVYNFDTIARYSDQYKFKHEVSWNLKVKNLANTGARVDFYVVKSTDNTDLNPFQELESVYTQQYIASNNVMAGGNPEEIQKQFQQYWNVPHAKDRAWKVVKHVTAVLNPGDEADIPLKVSSIVAWDAPGAQAYPKGIWSLIARVHGSLDIDKTDPSQVSISGASLACKMDRRYKLSVQKSLFDAVRRRSPLVSGAVVTPVTAGDGMQMDVVS